MNTFLARAAALMAAVALPALCVETRFWTQNDQDEFDKGKLTRLSLRSDGRLLLAPTFREVFDSAVPYLWTLASDSKGNLYTGGGGPSATTATVFVIDVNGKSQPLATMPGLEIHAIAINSKDQVFAATSPDSKIYRIANGKAELFYDPKAKYVWGMAFDSKGTLYIATGDQGDVHRVTSDGKGAVFFKTEETHCRSISVDANDNVLVGTEPGGLILRINAAGEGFVLYQAPKREITSVAVAKDGNIYATGVGNKGGTSTLPPTLSLPAPIPMPSAAAASGAAITLSPRTAAPTLGSSGSGAAPSTSGGSELYRIEHDNYVRRVWSTPVDIAYAIAFDSQNRPIVATGNKGNIYRVDSDNLSTLLINALPTQVTALVNTRKGGLYAATGNIGKIFQIGPQPEKDGVFESDPLDVGSFSYWGRLDSLADASGGKITYETRSGNLDRPQKNWSKWAPVDVGNRVQSPSARFLQYRVTLASGADGRSPELRQVEIAYMAKNVAPVVDELEPTPANYRFPPNALSITPTQTLTLPPVGQKRRTAPNLLGASSASSTLQYAKGFIGARWLATDANGDELIYRVEIKGRKETQWKLLKDKVKEPYISFDSNGYPDGDYQIRVTAIDSPANPPDQALSGQLASDMFLIDNTPPVISALNGARSGGKVTIRWHAKDDLSVIERAEYSLNGQEWIPVEPGSRLSDAPELDYVLVVDAPAGENTVAVRVRDDYDNESAAKVVIP